MESDIVSILNLKNGVGCSCLAWNIAHTLQLNLYQHDKAMHHIYNAKRNEIAMSVHLFGIEHGEEILANHYNIQEIARISGIGQSYGVEVSKGVKLSRFVELKKNQL